MPVQGNRLTPADGLDLSTRTDAPTAGSLTGGFKLPNPPPLKLDLAVFLDAGDIDLWIYFYMPDLVSTTAKWVLGATFDALDPAALGLRTVDVPAGAFSVYFREEGNNGATTRLLAAFAAEQQRETL